jgi:hypothetical protein
MRASKRRVVWRMRTHRRYSMRSFLRNAKMKIKLRSARELSACVCAGDRALHAGERAACTVYADEQALSMQFAVSS